jgi:hypothetical protein
MFGFQTGEDVDVAVMNCCGGDHQSVGMESSDGNWGGSITKEARVWLKVRYWLTVVDVEDLDAMSLCATGWVSMTRSSGR